MLGKSKTACKAYYAIDVEPGLCWPPLLFRTVQADVDPLSPFVIPTLLVTAIWVETLESQRLVWGISPNWAVRFHDAWAIDHPWQPSCDMRDVGQGIVVVDA